MSEGAVLTEEEQSQKLQRIAIDSETLQNFYDLEKRVPVKQVKAAFVSEFKAYNPDIAQTVDNLRKNTDYVSFVIAGHEPLPDIRGLTSPFYRLYPVDPWTHRVQVEATRSADQDQHVLTHEWIHGLAVVDVGTSWTEGDVKKQRLTSRMGFKRMEAVVVSQAGKSTEVTDVKVVGNFDRRYESVLEALTEWKARKISMKYFPEKFTDFHESFATGYQGVSIIEWLEEQAQIAGLADGFQNAADEALVLGDERNFIQVVNSIFPGKNAFDEVLDTFGKEVEVLSQMEGGLLTPNQAVEQIQKVIYPDLLNRLKP